MHAELSSWSWITHYGDDAIFPAEFQNRSDNLFKGLHSDFYNPNSEFKYN